MASKKYILIMALALLVQSVGWAQTDWGWDWKDTSKFPLVTCPNTMNS
jgi:OOP family OmpA-OmpF porin